MRGRRKQGPSVGCVLSLFGMCRVFCSLSLFLWEDGQARVSFLCVWGVPRSLSFCVRWKSPSVFLSAFGCTLYCFFLCEVDHARPSFFVWLDAHCCLSFRVRVGKPVCDFWCVWMHIVLFLFLSGWKGPYVTFLCVWMCIVLFLSQ